MSRDLVVFGEDWGRHPTSTQHLIKGLRDGRRILYVNSVGLRRPRLNLRDIGRLFEKIRQRLTEGSSEKPARMIAPDGINLVYPLVIPWPGNPLARRVNRWLLSRRLTRLIKELDIQDPILWISIPTGFVAAGALGERTVIYYCGDDFAALDGVDHKPVSAIERELVERADLVLACSEELVGRFPPEKTTLIPHGVEADRFGAAAPRPVDLPSGAPVAGFYGSFLDRIDTAILRKAAQELPDWQFVFIGDISPEESVDLRNLPNTTFLGPRPYEELASYLQHWQVSLLPFRDCAMVRAMNPLKLREYLAAGTPIASVEFPALQPYRELVCVAEDRFELADAIRRAAADAERNGLRRAAVAQETWEYRSGQVAQALAGLP